MLKTKYVRTTKLEGRTSTHLQISEVGYTLLGFGVGGGETNFDELQFTEPQVQVIHREPSTTDKQ